MTIWTMTETATAIVTGTDTATALVTCATLTCGEHGTCVDEAGGAMCDCDEGWVGVQCEACAADHIEEGGDVSEDVPWDLDGLPRVYDDPAMEEDIVDMGAFEYIPPMP